MPEMLQEISEQEVREMLIARIQRYGSRRTLQRHLAAKIGISQAMLSAVLHGVKKPSAKILKFLGVKREITYWKDQSW